MIRAWAYFINKMYGLRAYTMTRSENPYATHIPVLIGLARLISIRRVLELGCGDYSTRTFLNETAFPELSLLHSIENDREWAERTSSSIEKTSRFQLTPVETQMSLYIPSIRDWNYELIFIDDSLTAAERAETIQQVAQHCHANNIIVIHDFDVLDYRHASRHWPHRFTFTGIMPHVGIAWDEADLDREHLRRLDRLIADHASTIDPDDIDSWINIFNKNLLPAFNQ